MQPTDLIAYWGSENLRKYYGTSLQGIAIPQTGKEFLERIGIPIIHDPLFHFEPEEAPFQLVDAPGDVWQIGNYDSNPICVKQHEGGVHFCDPHNHASRFMNTGIGPFVLVLTLYEQMIKKCRLVTDIQRIPVVEAAKEQMKSIDPKAFASEEYYWPIVFEQIGYECGR